MQNEFLFIINDKVITKDKTMEEFKQILENQKLYIIIISSKAKNKLIINDFKLTKIIKPNALMIEYKIIKNIINSINIKIKDKNNNIIPMNIIKNMNCYFDKSYLKLKNEIFYFK